MTYPNRNSQRDGFTSQNASIRPNEVRSALRICSALLRCELDAAFFHLYTLNREDTAFVMDTFPIVRKHDEKAHGEYRTKRVILEIYDALAAAQRTGQPYTTRLDPPPADPNCCHPPKYAPPTDKKNGPL
jgi:hypothetical protein